MMQTEWEGERGFEREFRRELVEKSSEGAFQFGEFRSRACHSAERREKRPERLGDSFCVFAVLVILNGLSDGFQSTFVLFARMGVQNCICAGFHTYRFNEFIWNCEMPRATTPTTKSPSDKRPHRQNTPNLIIPR